MTKGVFMAGKRIDQIDKHVGNRVRMQRMVLGITQERLAAGLGITFQQVQKYEKGTNRISASRLQAIAQILKVTPAFLFGESDAVNDRSETSSAKALIQCLTKSEGATLMRSFVRIKDKALRRTIVRFVEMVAPATGTAGRV
jgi:transcriptional regulator with XRE-family HTH domain